MSNRGWWMAARAAVDVAGQMAVDLADEAQRQVDLVVALPAGAADSAHRAEQQVADAVGRANGDEQAVHRVLIAKPAGGIMVVGPNPIPEAVVTGRILLSG